MGPKSILFVRHAQSIGNTMTQDQRANYEVPNHSYPLTDIGEQQATITGKYLAEKLSNDLPELYFQSNFLRTQMTMSKILLEIGGSPAVITDSRLDEKWDGIFHELCKADIEKYYPEQIRLRKRRGYYHYRAPGGENCPDAELRIRSFLSDPLLKNKKILVVGHGRWAIIMYKILYNLTVEEFLKLKDSGLKDGGTENCSVVEFYQDLSVEPKCVVPWKGQLSEEKTELA